MPPLTCTCLLALPPTALPTFWFTDVTTRLQLFDISACGGITWSLRLGGCYTMTPSAFVPPCTASRLPMPYLDAAAPLEPPQFRGHILPPGLRYPIMPFPPRVGHWCGTVTTAACSSFITTYGAVCPAYLAQIAVYGRGGLDVTCQFLRIERICPLCLWTFYYASPSAYRLHAPPSSCRLLVVWTWRRVTCAAPPAARSGMRNPTFIHYLLIFTAAWTHFAHLVRTPRAQ